MKKIIYHLKQGGWIASLIGLALGVTLLVWPAASTRALAQLIGVVLLVHGLISALTHFWRDQRTAMDNLQSLVSLIVAIVGVWVWINPSTAVPIIPVLLALFLILHGAQDLLNSWKLRQSGDELALLFFCLSLAITAAGLALFLQPQALRKIQLFLTGIALTFDGGFSAGLELRLLPHRSASSKSEKTANKEEQSEGKQ